MNLTEYESIIESILFASGAPVAAAQLASATALELDEARAIASGLSKKYLSEKRGIMIAEANDTYQMCTNPQYFEYIKKVHQSAQRKILTQPLLETLSIIAYRQPVTKSQIEDIRGVNADHTVYKLMEYGLVTEKGRQDTPGRPILLGTTDEFLRYFGYRDLEQLPRFDNEREQMKKEAEDEVDNKLK